MCDIINYIFLSLALKNLILLHLTEFMSEFICWCPVHRCTFSAAYEKTKTKSTDRTSDGTFSLVLCWFCSRVPFQYSYFTTVPHICRSGMPGQTEGDHKVRHYWSKAYSRSDVVLMKSFIARSDSIHIAPSEGNGDAAAEQQGSTPEKTTSPARSNHIMILI